MNLKWYPCTHRVCVKCGVHFIGVLKGTSYDAYCLRPCLPPTEEKPEETKGGTAT